MGCGASSSAAPLAASPSEVGGHPHKVTSSEPFLPSAIVPAPASTPSDTKRQRKIVTTATTNLTPREDIFSIPDSPPQRPAPETAIHSTVSSTQIESKGVAPVTPCARASNQARQSHSSKLDMHTSRDTEHEKAEIISKILVCRNCEDIHLPLAVWCTDCHRLDDDAPPVYCDACNADLHQFAKTKNHVRQSLHTIIHTSPMKTAQELGLAGTLLPPGLPVLESLACSNCDGDPSMYCSQCKSILCTTCARDIHNPKLLRSHTRNPLVVRFVLSKDQESPKGGITTAIDTKKSTTPQGVTSPTLKKQLSLGESTGLGSKPAPASGGGVFMPTSLLSKPRVSGVKHRVRITETSDIVPHENPGLAGDVFTFGDPSINEGLNEIQLEFRNVTNPYDTIGSGVQIVSIACGMDHAGCVTSLGSLFMFGSNVEGQLGCGRALGDQRWTKEPILIEFPRHAPVKAIACGSVHTLALCQDSTVWSWGEGKMGKLGQVTDADLDVPTLVELAHWGPRGEDEADDMSGDETVIGIACGQNNSGCFVKGRKDKHQLYIWGEGASGQIPQPPPLSSSAASSSTAAAAASAGGSHSLLPKLLPQLVAIHVPENRTDPYPEVTCLAFGTKHVAVGTKVGSLFTWGDNAFGQCGYTLATNDGDNLALQLTPRLVPKLYLDGVKVASISCGERHTSILSTTGDVWSFGSGESHQLGIFDNIDQFQPQQAVGLGPSSNNIIKHIHVGASITTAVNEAGETFVWGYGVETPTPKLLQGLRGKAVQAVCVGSNANMVLLTGSAAELYEWQFDGAPLDAEETHGVAAGEATSDDGDGHNSHDDHDDHPSGGKGTPTVNVNLRGKRLVAMSSGKNHYLVVTGDGKVYAWGSNHSYETGLKLPSDVTYVPHPLELKFKSHKIIDVRCGVEHSIALTSEGQVYTWGSGFEGRLGHISNGDVPEPKLITTLSEAGICCTSIAIGPSNTAVVTKDGSCYIWGAGNGGQIGNEDLMPVFKPTLMKTFVQLNEKVVEIALGNYHACVRTESCKIFTFGDNKFGQLGLSGQGFHEDYSTYPQPVESLNRLNLKPKHIECGDNICMVLTECTGELYGWGTGETMQICLKDPPVPTSDRTNMDEDFSLGEDITTPTKLKFPFQKTKENFVRITSFSVRDINCCCLTADSSLYVWGWDLGEYPTKVDVKKPIRDTPSSTAASSLPGAIAPTETVKFDKVTLGHTRMLLMTP